MLELAAGTGALTRELVASGADVLATDVNPAMVRAGRQRVPQARWAQADAAAPGLPEASIDVVACQFGIMFFPDRAAAYTAVRHVLTPGGTFLASTWAGLDRHGLQQALVQALAEVFPHDPPTFFGTVPHAYRDPEVVAADLDAAGFTDITLSAVTLPAQVLVTAEVAVGYCTGTPLRAALAERGEVAELAAAVAERMVAALGPGPLSVPMTAYVAQAVQPQGQNNSS